MSNHNRVSICIAMLLTLIVGCAESAPKSAQTDADASSGRNAGQATPATGSGPDTQLTEAERVELETMARDTLKHLVDSNEAARELYDRSDHYAVFDSTKVGALVTGAGGSGVAVNTDDNQCVYMHMGAGGLGLGGGVQKYKLVFLFEDDRSFEKFVDGRWDAGTTAQAVAGKAAVEGASNFVDGLAVYQLTDKGLIAQADLTMMRVWRDADAPPAEADAGHCLG